MIREEELAALRGLRSEGGIVSAYVAVDPRLLHDPNHPTT
jgi:hypothetical protein